MMNSSSEPPSDPLQDLLREAIDDLAAKSPMDDARSASDAATTDEGDIEFGGRYRLVDTLGHGGFGVVWLAQQIKPIQRDVALKVIKPGMDSREIIARFEAERQTLAMMDHPHIAAVLDAGTTAQGRPYFVMELVKGTPITSYCDERQLTIRERIQLFIPVCQAVHHAHQKSVLHRDLKPTNILVTEVDGKPVPKVIDFGIAKALGTSPEAALEASRLQTQAGAVIGTPQYMSPEQAGATPDLDTRSDIYALGVILYELLTGETPLARESLLQNGLQEVLRQIRETDPPKPSNRIASQRPSRSALLTTRHTDAYRLSRLLRGDLDWIVLKALEKDRTRRYESANQLADDIRKHLEDKPVDARPPSKSYLISRLFRRNKLAFTAAGVILLSLIIGLIVSTRFYLRSEKHRLLAEARTQEAHAARVEQERLKSDATDAASKYRLGATTADFQLAVRSLTPESDSESLDNLARALETDPSNHSAVALALHLMQSRPQILMRRASEPAKPARYIDILASGLLKNWEPSDLLAREFVRMLHNPSYEDSAQQHLSTWSKTLLPADRLFRREDYPDPYRPHVYQSWSGWHGHMGSPSCLHSFEVVCGISEDHRHAVVVDQSGGFGVYRFDKVPVFERHGMLKDWPSEDFKAGSARSLYPKLKVDASCEWLAVGSYDVKTGARNTACGLWNLVSGERALNSKDSPLVGIEAGGFHPSGAIAGFATFGRKALFVDLATRRMLPLERLYLNEFDSARFSPDGLRCATGLHEFLSMCSGHEAVPIGNVEWYTGDAFETGTIYKVQSASEDDPDTNKCLIAKPEVFCGGALPLVLSHRASTSSIQWNASGDTIVWCDGGNSIMRAKVRQMHEPGDVEIVVKDLTSSIKDFKLCMPRGRLVISSGSGLHVIAVSEEVRATSEPVHLSHPDLGRLALNPALDKGCVVQRVNGVDALLRFTLTDPKFLPGKIDLWSEKQNGTEAVLRDFEFSPDGSILAVNASASPAFQLVSAAFLEVETNASMRIKGTKLATYLGGDVIWGGNGDLLGRGDSGSGFEVFRVQPASPGDIAETSAAKVGRADSGVSHRVSFVPGSGRYVLSGNTERKSIRLMERELDEIIAEWPFPSGIDAIEASPSGECFAVLTGKRLEIYWLPPLDEKAPTWFPTFLRLLTNHSKNTAEAVATLASIESSLAHGEGADESPRICEAVTWALSQPDRRPVFPGIRVAMDGYIDHLLQKASPEWRKRALNTAILQNIRSSSVYREAAKNPPEGLADPSPAKWRTFYETLATEFKRSSAASPIVSSRPTHPPQTPVPFLAQSTARWQADLARAHFDLSDSLRIQRHYAEAEEAVHKATEICQRLLREKPDDLERLFFMMSVPNRLGLIYEGQMKVAEARTAYEDWNRGLQRLIAKDPANRLWLQQLGRSYSSVARVCHNQADWPSAAAAYAGAISTHQKLSSAEPEALSWRIALADGHNLLGLTLRQQGKLGEAMNEFRASLSILDPLRTEDNLAGDTAHWPERVQGNLEETLAMVNSQSPSGLFYRAVDLREAATKARLRKDWPAAKSAAEEARKILNQILIREPDHVPWLAELSESHYELGSVLYHGMRDPASAGEVFSEWTETAEHLMQLEPTNPKWIAQARNSHAWRANVADALGDNAGAIKERGFELALQQKLPAPTKEDPSGWRSMAFAHYRLALALRNAGRLAEALNHMTEALDHVEKYHAVSKIADTKSLQPGEVKTAIEMTKAMIEKKP